LKVNDAQTQHFLKKQLKIFEDPWENYLVHDAKYFMPLLCHSQMLNIEEQVLLASFIRHSIKEESISEYKLKPSALVDELITFATNFKDDEEEPSLLEKLAAILKSRTAPKDSVIALEEEMERVLKMFYLQMRVKGHLKPYKDDYFV